MPARHVYTVRRLGDLTWTIVCADVSAELPDGDVQLAICLQKVPQWRADLAQAGESAPGLVATLPQLFEGALFGMTYTSRKS